MSLILEALRKSEAQRRLGDAPDLLAQTTNLSGPARRGIPAWPWFFAGLVLVAATAWWLGSQTPVAPARVGESGRPPPIATAADSPEAPPADHPAGASQPDRDAVPAPATATRREVASQAAKGVASAPPPAPEPGAAESLSPSSPAPAMVTPEATAPASDGPASAADLARLRARLEAVAQRQAAQERSEITAEVEDAPAIATPTPEAGEPIRRFEELSPGERNGVPELKFSLHVFADDPAGRFVVLGGRRLGEGAAIGPRVRIAEIRRDGAVVEIDGRPVLVGRP